MGNVSRFVCVSIPFVLTIGSIVFLLAAGLSGVTSASPGMYSVTPKDLQLPLSALQSLSNVSASNLTALQNLQNIPGTISSKQNLTAKNLNLADSYTFYLWSFSATINGTTTQSAPALDYFSGFNTTALNATAAATGATLPPVINGGLALLQQLMKWAQIALILSLLLQAITLVVGIFGFVSKLGSCITYLVCGVATLATIGFAAIGTAASIGTVGLLQSGTKFGLFSAIFTSWLIVAWIAAAASVGAGAFWLFSACCCSASHHKHGSRHSAREEKPYSGYQRVHDPFVPVQQTNIYNPPQQFPMHNVATKQGAYEPYSHAHV